MDQSRRQPRISPVIAALIAGAIGGDETVDHVSSKLNADESVGIVRSSRRATKCCRGHDRRDGVVVAAMTVETATEVFTGGTPSAYQSIAVFAVDEHKGEFLNLSMDLESLERHVNNCTEVIAWVRQRNEEMAAAATGGYEG